MIRIESLCFSSTAFESWVYAFFGSCSCLFIVEVVLIFKTKNFEDVWLKLHKVSEPRRDNFFVSASAMFCLFKQRFSSSKLLIKAETEIDFNLRLFATVICFHNFLIFCFKLSLLNPFDDRKTNSFDCFLFTDFSLGVLQGIIRINIEDKQQATSNGNWFFISREFSICRCCWFFFNFRFFHSDIFSHMLTREWNKARKRIETTEGKKKLQLLIRTGKSWQQVGKTNKVCFWG